MLTQEELELIAYCEQAYSGYPTVHVPGLIAIIRKLQGRVAELEERGEWDLDNDRN